MSTTFHWVEKQIQPERNREKSNRVNRKNAYARTSISSYLTFSSTNSCLRYCNDVYEYQTIEANKCQMIGLSTYNSISVIQWRMQIRPFLTAFQFAQNLTSFHNLFSTSSKYGFLLANERHCNSLNVETVLLFPNATLFAFSNLQCKPYKNLN